MVSPTAERAKGRSSLVRLLADVVADLLEPVDGFLDAIHGNHLEAMRRLHPARPGKFRISATPRKQPLDSTRLTSSAHTRAPPCPAASAQCPPLWAWAQVHQPPIRR